jgi:hypothetical protein
MTGNIKVSLHASGDWRHAFSSEHYKKPAPFAPSKRRRVIKRWSRPREFALGYTRAFQILIPDQHIVTPQDDGIHGLGVHWIERPGSDRELCLSFILGPLTAAGWPGRDTMGTQLITQRDLGSGERLWILAHSYELAGARAAALDDVSRNLRLHFADEPRALFSNPTLRVLALGEEDGTGLYQDLSLMVLMRDDQSAEHLDTT